MSKYDEYHFADENLAPDTFLIRYGGDGFGSYLVTGFEEAKKLFALLHSEDETDEMFQHYLAYANDENNWHFGADGSICDLTILDEGGWADIRRVTMPPEVRAA